MITNEESEDIKSIGSDFDPKSQIININRCRIFTSLLAKLSAHVGQESATSQVSTTSTQDHLIGHLQDPNNGKNLNASEYEFQVIINHANGDNQTFVFDSLE